MTDVRLPRVERRTRKSAAKTDPELYRCRIVEREGGRVKVHYISYGRQHDEWKAQEEIVSLEAPSSDTSSTPTPIYYLYRVLANHIKTSLRGGRKDDPKIRLEMPFDRIHFDGGLLQMCEQLKKVWRGNEVYTIRAYSDLDCLLD